MRKSTAHSVLFIVIAMLLAAPSILAAVPPQFGGEVYAGKIHTPHEGDVALLWVFDGRQFQEFIFFRNTGRLHPVAASTCDRVDIDRTRGIGHYAIALAGNSFQHVQFDAQHVELAPGGKKLLKISDHGNARGSATASGRFAVAPEVCAYGVKSQACDDCTDCGWWDEPPDLTPPDAGADYYFTPVEESFRGACCDLCYGVHDVLGIHVYDCICCLGGCRRWGFRCILYY